MVKAACEPFDNVLVLSMGKLVLSSYTMPEYFKKDELQNILIDPAKDVEIFATFVAPELNITKDLSVRSLLTPLLDNIMNV